MAATDRDLAGFGADLSTVLAFVGLAFILYKLLRLVQYVARVVKSFWLAPLLGWHLDVKPLGTWAVVTGATSGIGKAYAEQLAAKGMNIVLVSRNPEKLRSVATEIESQCKVATKIVVIDFTTDDMERYRRVGSELEGLDIGVLVNNAGMAYHGRFTEQKNMEELYPNLIRCNIISVTMMTSIVLPGMLKRKRGAVINISSSSAFIPTPGLTAYSATKAYVDYFTRGLQIEYETSGVIFQSVLPCGVSTNMYTGKPGAFVPLAPDYVKSCLATLGNESRTAGYKTHELMRVIALSLPEAFYQRQIFEYMQREWKRRPTSKEKKAN